MAIIRLVPSTYYLSNTSYLSVSDTNNMYNNTDNTSYATVTNSQNGTSSYYIYLRGFNFSSVPSDAIINSFTVKLKARESGVSTSTSYRPYLCNNTSTITNAYSNVLSTSEQTLTFSNDSITWETLKGYGDDFGIRINCRRANSNTTGYVYIYGAEIEVDYTIPIYHQITTINNTDLVESIIPEGLTNVLEGDDYSLKVYAETFGDFVVEDNGVDVTNQLVQKENVTTGTTTSVAQSNFETGVSSSNASFYMSSSSQGTTNLQMPIGYTAESPNTATDQGNGYTYIKDNNNNTATGWIIYSFDFSSIPQNATIDSVSVKVYGCREESTVDSTHVAKVGLYTGTTLKGSEQEFSSTSNAIMTISNVGTWTREELQNAKLRFTVAYYGGRIKGITWTVNYSTPSSIQYYWEYTLSNVSADHTIYVKEPIVIPPDEDPTKEYYPITISSINATTTPGKGTTRVESGTSETIYIYPTDPLLTLVTDNGVDITSQLVQHGGTIPDPTVTTTAPGASYGFNLDSSTGYYESTNNGVASSAAVCRVTFNLPVRCLVTIQYINYAEATYDYGIFGNIDSALSSAYTADSDVKLACDTNTYNVSTPQTLTYEMESGEHFIDIKYRKDTSQNSNNDNLQWKITSIEPLETNLYYTYDLSNISQEHSLVFIFGDVTYYFVNSSTNSDCTLYPNGQMVQLPGDSYRLTIAPKNSGDTITMTDNNVNVTSQLERKEVTTEKDGQTITVVNYIYRLSNIQATHNLVVSSALQNLSSSIYLNSQWNEGTLNRKQDSRWGTLSYTRIWVHNGSAWIENAQRTITTNGMIFGGVINIQE